MSNLRPDRMRARARGAGYKRQLELLLWAAFGMERVVAEHRFHATRRWRFDLAVPDVKLAVEYEGHGSTGGGGHVGRHASISGMAGDAEKYAQAQLDGWLVLRFTALHFTEKDRRKHKLTAPGVLIARAIETLATRPKPRTK